MFDREEGYEPPQGLIRVVEDEVEVALEGAVNRWQLGEDPDKKSAKLKSPNRTMPILNPACSCLLKVGTCLGAQTAAANLLVRMSKSVRDKGRWGNCLAFLDTQMSVYLWQMARCMSDAYFQGYHGQIDVCPAYTLSHRCCTLQHA